MHRLYEIVILTLICFYGIAQCASIPYPDYLKPGDKIAIIAPSGYLSQTHRNNLRMAIEKVMINKWKMQVVLGKNIFKNSTKSGGWAGFDHERLEDLQGALDDKEVKAIFCARGGYGFGRIIDDVDFTIFEQYPKFFIGFSDITHMLAAMDKRGYKTAVHAMMPATYDFEDPQSLVSLENILFGRPMRYKFPPHKFNKFGNVEAPIVGGNLYILMHTFATQTEVDVDGKILFIEEIDEAAYKLDGMMTLLRRSGKLSKLKGLIVGHFSNYKGDQYFPPPKDANDVIHEALGAVNFPVAYGIPIGHENDNVAVPIGYIAKFKVDASGTSIEFVRP
jgi:muramoyltetrapeptide carboxypeptidase